MTFLLQTPLLANLDPWPAFGVVLAVALGGALVVHAAVYGTLHRIRRTAPERLPLRGLLVLNTERSARWVLVLLALRANLGRLPAEADGVTGSLAAVVSIGLVVAVARLVIRAMSAVRQSLGERLDTNKADNLSERRILTQIGLFQRLLNVLEVVIAAAVILVNL